MNGQLMLISTSSWEKTVFAQECLVSAVLLCHYFHNNYLPWVPSVFQGSCKCSASIASFNPISTLGRVSPQVAVVEWTPAGKSVSRVQVFNHRPPLPPVGIACPRCMGWVRPSPALRDTLISGPKQVADGPPVRILLMMSIILSCSVFSVRMKGFFLWPQHLKALLFLDNCSVSYIRYTRLIQLDMFSSLLAARIIEAKCMFCP